MFSIGVGDRQRFGVRDCPNVSAYYQRLRAVSRVVVAVGQCYSGVNLKVQVQS